MRAKPYTEIGISRVPCARCGAPSKFQWQVCADKRQFRGVCVDCDIALNTLAMRFFFGKSREADIRTYAKKARI